MSFTDKERARWLAEKRQREAGHQHLAPELRPVAVCSHCQRPFTAAEGDAYSEFPICDACNSD